MSDTVLPVLPAFLADGGSMGARLREHDWSTSPLGLPERWPAALQTATAIMLSAQHAMFIAWGEAHTLVYNDAYAPMLGRKHPAALDCPLLEVWAEIRAEVLPLVERAYGGEPVRMDDIGLMMDRYGYLEEGHFSFTHTPLRDIDGTVAGLLCMLVETTPDILAEQRRRDERTRQRQLFEASPGFIALFEGAEHRYEFVNSAFLELFGEGEYIGRPAAAVGHGGLRQALAQGLEACWRSGQRSVAYDLPIALEADAGQPARSRFVHLIHAPLLDERGELRGVFVEGQDVTAKHLAEAALRASESRFSALAQNLPIAVWIAGPSGLLEWFNSQSYTYSGYTLDDLARRNWVSVVHPDDLPGTKALWRQAVQHASSYEAQMRLRRNDGSYRWHLSRAVPVRDAAGEVSLWVGTSTDVHDQQLSAQRLHEQNESLISAEKHQAQALRQAEEQLRQAQKMEAVGQLTGGIAHDFNNLLTGIIGSLEMMTRRIAQGRYETLGRYIEAAIGSSERAASLTHRLLAFGRRQPLEPRQLNARQLVADMAELLERTLGPQYELRLQQGESDPLTFCDPSQLQSSILNLALNARDAMPGGGRLSIDISTLELTHARGELGSGGYVRISLTDNGTGMSADVLGHAIEPFFTTKPVGQGTGLGLSMVYGFARQSEGQLLLESVPGQGTTVSIFLPRVAEAPVPPTVEALPVSCLAGKRVVLVEDEPVIRELILELLGELGLQAFSASQGMEGLELMRGDVPIDLLITDIGLPGLNGRELADRAIAWRPELRVLFITGYEQGSELVEGSRGKNMDMLAKPFSVNDLKAMIVGMLLG
jgi:PAS domain S-box-containing protein